VQIRMWSARRIPYFFGVARSSFPSVWPAALKLFSLSLCLSKGRILNMKIARFAFPVVALFLVATLFSASLMHAQIGKLEIVKAFYGKNGKGNDVTRHLQRMIQNNTLDVKVNNDNMGGDPNVGADKSLKVDYTYRGQTLHKVVKEGDRLKLP